MTLSLYRSAPERDNRIWENLHKLKFVGGKGFHLFEETGEYRYPWKSQFEEPRVEMIFADKIRASIHNGRLLDVGCGHGEFALAFAREAREVVGIDVVNMQQQKDSKYLIIITC